MADEDCGAFYLAVKGTPLNDMHLTRAISRPWYEPGSIPCRIVVPDQSICDCYNRRWASTAFKQRNICGVVVGLMKLENPLGVGMPKAVNRLVYIANDRERSRPNK